MMLTSNETCDTITTSTKYTAYAAYLCKARLVVVIIIVASVKTVAVTFSLFVHTQPCTKLGGLVLKVRTENTQDVQRFSVGPAAVR